MILYIDETENQDYFIVAGLLAESQLVVDNSFRHLKNRINKLNYKAKDKNAYKNALYLDCCKYYFVHEKLLKRGE